MLKVKNVKSFNRCHLDVLHFKVNVKCCTYATHFYLFIKLYEVKPNKIFENQLTLLEFIMLNNMFHFIWNKLDQEKAGVPLHTIIEPNQTRMK